MNTKQKLNREWTRMDAKVVTDQGGIASPRSAVREVSTPIAIQWLS